MKVVPSNRFHEIEAKRAAIRAEYPMVWHQIFSRAEALQKEICEMAAEVDVSQLTPGRNYGVLMPHMGTNARDEKRGRWLVNHGDVVIELWTWSGPEGECPGCFYTKNGLGYYDVKKDPAGAHNALIELP